MTDTQELAASEPRPILPDYERFGQALEYANYLHRCQARKGSNIAYVSHVIQVAGLVLEYGGTEDQAIGALFHDAYEDVGEHVLQDIGERFGDEVTRIVQDCSDAVAAKPGEAKPEWWVRKLHHVEKIGDASESTRIVAAADKLHNARSILQDVREQGDELFNLFTEGKAATFWYYRAMIDAFRRTGTCPPLVDELVRTVNEAERFAYHDDARQL